MKNENETKKEDLRVTKTKRIIKEEFLKLVQKKPVDKITVTELAANALINKGTFYLHYSDIYSLYREVLADAIENTLGTLTYYDEFFTDPKSFVAKFLTDFRERDIKCIFPYIDPSKERLPLPYLINQVVLSHILDTGLIEPTMENKIRIQGCIAAITAPLMHFGSEYVDLIAKVSGELLTDVFQK